jgi:hypothetical protein
MTPWCVKHPDVIKYVQKEFEMSIFNTYYIESCRIPEVELSCNQGRLPVHFVIRM